MSADPKSPSPPRDDFIAGLGPAFLAHLLRRISDRLVDADAAWHEEINLGNPPRTSSTLLALESHGPHSVTQLAKRLDQSHQLVQQWIRALKSAGLVAVNPDGQDGRRSMVSLTSRGRAHVQRLEQTVAAVGEATERLLADISPSLVDQLWALEHALRERDFVADIRQAYDSRDH